MYVFGHVVLCSDDNLSSKCIAKELNIDHKLLVGTDASKRKPVSLTSSPLSCLLDLRLWALISVDVSMGTTLLSVANNEP